MRNVNFIRLRVFQERGRELGELRVEVERLRKEAEALGLHAEVAPDVATAVSRAVDAAADTEAVVVTGSLYTVGEARELLLGGDE
jgi:folylpolyglutamate synthase/dihydropteroate synthase